MSRVSWYWILQISGWTIYAILGVTLAGIFYEINQKTILFQFFGAVTMLLSTHLFRFLITKWKWLELTVYQLILRVIPTILILALIVNSMVTAYGIMFTDIIPEGQFSLAIFMVYAFQAFVYFVLWTGIYLSVHYFRNYKQEEIEKWKLQSAVKDAELIALKAQINPHFLFNALNNIRALILEDHMKARDMVSHLSELLRYSIQFNSNEKVTIWEELDIVEKYLELEAIHYENRLKFKIDSEEKLKKYKIPPMIIQLMAENAVKHGISQIKGGGEINVAVRSAEDDLILEVSNTGELKSKDAESGIGLRNAMERIRILFEKEPDLELYEKDGMVNSILKLPMVK